MIQVGIVATKVESTLSHVTHVPIRNLRGKRVFERERERDEVEEEEKMSGG